MNFLCGYKKVQNHYNTKTSCRPDKVVSDEPQSSSKLNKWRFWEICWLSQSRFCSYLKTIRQKIRTPSHVWLETLFKQIIGNIDHHWTRQNHFTWYQSKRKDYKWHLNDFARNCSLWERSLLCSLSSVFKLVSDRINQFYRRFQWFIETTTITNTT